MQRQQRSRLEFGCSVLLVTTIVFAWCGFSLPARTAGIVYSGLALWTLFKERTARARLLCGFSLPLLMMVGGIREVLLGYLALAFLVLAVQERGWSNRIASLLTLVFPALLIVGIRLYLRWLNYEPFWIRIGP